MAVEGPSIEELRALARAVALNASLVVEWGAPGAGWCLDVATGSIRCDPQDAQLQHPDESRGLVCHEAAHAAVTRYPHLIPRSTLASPGMASLLNALEDCRIETWLAARFPGSEPWIRLYNDRLFPIVSVGLSDRPRIHQYCIGAIHRWWRGVDADGLAVDVQEALAATLAAREEVVQCQPPIDVTVVASGYEGSHLARRFRDLDTRCPPDAFERGVRLAAFQAWRIVWEQIRPTYEGLLRRDLAERKQLGSEDRVFLDRMRGIWVPIPLGQAVRRLDGGAPGATEVPEVPVSMRAAAEQASRATPDDAYAVARRAVSPLIEEMVQSLEPLIRRGAVPRWQSGHRSGGRVDLRDAMRAEADPLERDRIWQRKSLPHKHDPAVLLLLDLSGSMEGPGIEEGFKGVVLLCEVLERLQIPFAVEGFQNTRIPFKDLHTPLDHAARQQLGRMPEEVQGVRRGGNNRPADNWDGPVLRSAGADVADWPMQHRVLIVVCDGRPSGPADGGRVLADAVAEVEASGAVHLIGVGLGPSTQHVADFYGTHVSQLPLDTFPAALGALLADRVLVLPVR